MYQYKELYTIDFSDVRYYLQMHRVIKEALDFPDYYGENWDAFWDCLTDMVGRPINIQILGIETIEKLFPGEEKNLIELLYELKHHNNDKYSHEIKIEIVRAGNKRMIE